MTAVNAVMDTRILGGWKLGFYDKMTHYFSRALNWTQGFRVGGN
jgi:hypothetical protein